MLTSALPNSLFQIKSPVMTQRHADSDDETYVTLGRPFELLETAEDVQKAKSRKDKDQFVTDSQGRRRFHGAFTGGFSAGYYNTVGSKEGWNPSSFKSTRGERSEFGGQRPEDFMDEEDFGAHGIAPKVVSAQEQFIQSQGERKRPATEDGVIPGVPPLENLVVPTKISIGARLLKAMGWREGEGVGPKTVKYHPKQDRVYGPARPGPSVEATSKIAEGFMFAPRDSTTWEFSGKDDLHGLDYRGMEERGVLSTRKATKDLYGMRGEAFGTGALEDEEGDDENVYGVESMTSYDVSLAGEGDLSMERSFGWTGRENDTWDLSSFSKALKKPVHYKSHPPPNVPKSFVLVHKFKKISAATDPSLGKPLSSTSRSHLLADTSGSVFGLLSPADRERLKNAVERTKDEPKSQSSTDQKREQPVAAPVAKNVTEWENEGKDRMTRAAAIYKPLGTSLASRFTRSGENQEAPKSPESDAVQAARSSMFGALTREIQDWYPHRIVCKRFNIPDPYPGQNFVGVDDGKKKRQDKNRAINFELTEKMVTDVPDEDPSPAVAEVMKEVSQEGSTDDQKEMQDDRPPMDLFKEIFANSDSEDESEETMHNNPSNIILSPALLNECKDIPVTSSRKQPIEMSNDTQWKDLSAISSSVKPSEDVKLPSISLKKYQYPLVSVADQSSNELKSAVASYGPSLPPGRDSNDHMSDKAGSVIRRQPNDYEHERHRTTHKKHKREERREHKERKKKKHKHSKH